MKRIISSLLLAVVFFSVPLASHAGSKTVLAKNVFVQKVGSGDDEFKRFLSRLESEAYQHPCIKKIMREGNMPTIIISMGDVWAKNITVEIWTEDCK